MVDELKPITKSWFIDRIRLGERYLRYNLDDIVNVEHFNNLRNIKTALGHRKPDEEEETSDSPYDNLSVSKDTPHETDELI